MSILSIFGGSSPQPVPIPQYTGLQLQTSSSAVPIPIVYGTNVVAPNIIFAGGFTAEPVYSGGSKPVITGYNYFENIIFGLCEGPVVDLGFIYQDGDIFTKGNAGGGANFTLVAGALPPVPASGPPFSNNNGLAYAGTAYVYSHDYNLGISAATGSLNIEVNGVFSGSSGINAFDADPALVLQDLLTNPRYGVGIPASALDTTTLFSPASGADASYQGYCKANNIAFSPALVSTEKANSIVTRWLQLTNSEAVWSGGKLKVIPRGDTPVLQVPTQATLTQTIPPLDPYTTSGPNNPKIIVNGGFISDGGVILASTGQALNLTTAAAIAANQGELPTNTYYLPSAQPNTYLFSGNNENSIVTISYTYKPLASFTPNLAAVYDITDDDLIADDSADPITVLRTDPSIIPNVQRIEVSDRGNQYAATLIEVREQNSIELYGYRLGSTITAHEITTGASGQLLAQLALQRALGIRNTYHFKLGWEFCLLEPMDLVTLTDAVLGMTKTTVRVTSIEEDGDGMLDVTAEEFSAGSIGTAMSYGTTVAGGASQNMNVTPSPVVPVIFEAPSQLANNQIEIIFGATSSTSGAPDPNYGGCNVYLSTDGTTYNQVASFHGQSWTGTTTADTPLSVTSPDTADAVAVNVALSGATLPPGSQAQAQNLETLFLLATELMSYGSATGTAGQSYSLTYLERGVYGTTAADHPPGSAFFSLEGPTGSAILPRSTRGTTVYFKFQAVNIFGKGAQDLSTCTPYSKAITGAGLTS